LSDYLLLIDTYKLGGVMGEFRFGMIGAGIISAYHAKAIEEHPDGVIAVMCDLDEKRGAEFGEEHNCEHMTDWKAMIARDDLDAVCVCSPSGLHGEHAAGIANAGKHVLVEKSMAINVKDATDMIVAARENNVKLGVIFQKRTDEAPNRIKKAVEDGEFGKIIFADVSAKYWRDQAYYDSADWRGTWDQEGGGATMTQGIHAIDLMLYMMGDVEKIYAKFDMVAHERIEVEDMALALLTYKNGALGSLHTASSTNPGQGNEFHINGTHGSVNLIEDNITSWATSDSKDTLAAETIGDVTGKAGSAASSASQFPVEGHIKQVANFIDAVRTGAPLVCDGIDGRRSLALIEALYLSSRRQEEVFVDEILKGLDV